MNTVLANGWSVEHVNEFDSLSQDNPVVSQSNYTSLNRIVFYYWESEKIMKKNIIDHSDVAFFRLKPKKQ